MDIGYTYIYIWIHIYINKYLCIWHLGHPLQVIARLQHRVYIHVDIDRYIEIYILDIYI